jgi:hypothetical protein
MARGSGLGFAANERGDRLEVGGSINFSSFRVEEQGKKEQAVGPAQIFAIFDLSEDGLTDLVLFLFELSFDHQFR